MKPRSEATRSVQVGFPFRINSYGRISDPEYPRHVEQMIELLLFTSPGDRVNRPDFGCGLLELLFGSDTQAVANAAQYVVRGALQQWLGDVLSVREVVVEPGDDGRLTIRLAYVLRQEEQVRVATFQPRGIPWRR